MASKVKRLFTKKFNFDKPEVPRFYKCMDCGATRCRLYRIYSTFCIELRCTKCAINYERPRRGKEDSDLPLYSTFRPHCIWGLIAAVPTEEGDGYWGYTSIPDRGVKWWDQLPL